MTNEEALSHLKGTISYLDSYTFKAAYIASQLGPSIMDETYSDLRKIDKARKTLSKLVKQLERD